MKLPISIVVGVAAACLMLCGGIAQAQSSITGVYPNGANMFQPSSTLSFTASSPAGVTAISVQLTVTSLYTGTSFAKNLSIGHGLTVTGPSTGYTVSAALNSNTLYSAVIQVTDAGSSVANQTVNFDTIAPACTWEAEDWDYNGGQYIDNPQTNLYVGLGTGSGDAFNNNGGAAYRPINPGLSTEGNGDQPRVPWIGSGLTDYDVGFTDGGDFGNYTRHYPAGVYNLFARVAGGNGPQTECADITVASGSAVISGDGGSPYKFGVKGRGWQNYDFMPVTDAAGNLVQVTCDGSLSTLNVLQNQGSDNMNFFMLMPTNVVVPSTVTITNLSPDGSALFNQVSTFSFTAFSTNDIDINGIIVSVTGTNLWGHGSVSNLTAASGLTISGSSTNWNVSFPVTSNTIYTVVADVSDADGNIISATVSFDTIVVPPGTPTTGANYTFEAEDFDWGGGQFFDNPQTNAYSEFDAITNVDYHLSGGQHAADYLRFGLTTETLSEKIRPQYNGTGKQDYDVGFNDGGNWGNYTRTYPAGTFNIYVRAANGTGNTSADSGSISLVTSGVGTTSQTLSQLGTFSVPAVAWATYGWCPVKDPAGNLAEFTGGSVETLRMTIDGGNCNENFFLLTPADPNSILQPYVTGFQPDGSIIFQPSNTLSFVVHSQPGTATGNIGLNLNGVNVSGMTFSGTPNIRNVSYPIQPNAFYTAIVTVTDSHGTVSTTNTFGTFDPNNYQWEAEDYDYTNGLYFDTNAPVNSYLGKSGVSGVDYFESDLNGPGRSSGSPYRPADGFNIPDATAGDQVRAQFTAGTTDYNIGSFGIDSWANYTRHYPLGTYNVVGRFAEGAGLAGANLALLINGVSTNLLGTFAIPSMGWGTWQWQELLDNSGKPSRVTFDGSAQILRLGGTTGNEVNVNFLMLVRVTPTPKLTATVGGGNIHISFPTETGYSYQVQYKANLTDASWTSLGSPISGNNAVQTANDPSTGIRFYRVQVQ